MTEINGRKVDLRNADPKLSEKIAIINKSIQDEPRESSKRNEYSYDGNG